MRKTFNRLWENKFFQGGILLTTSSFIINLANYLFNFLVAHSLGPAGFGEITSLFSYITLTAVPVSVLSNFVIQKISNNTNRLAYTASLEEYFFRQLKKWWLPLVAIFLLSPLIPRITNLTTISSYALPPIIALGFITSFYNASFLGLRLFWWSCLLALFATTLKLSGAILVSFRVDGLATIIISLLLSSLLVFCAQRYIFQRVIKSKIKDSSPRLEKRMIHVVTSRQFVITLLSVLALISFSNLDIIFVKKFFPPNITGIYSAWSLLAKIVLYLISPLSAIGLIYFASHDTRSQHRSTMNRTLLFLAVFSIFILIVYHFFAPMITTLLFGQRFSSVIPYFGKAAVFGIGYMYLSFFNSYFLAKKSNFTLILPLLLPFYVLSLFLLGKSIANIMNTNIVFMAILVTLYLSAYAYSIIFKNVEQNR